VPPPVEGIDDLTRWLGLRWEEPGRLRLAIRAEHMNPAGLLSGAITYTMVDYAMGSALWRERSGDERIATISVSINYVQTAREGQIVCTATVDRRNDRIAVLRSEVKHDDGRLIATAVGSYAIFPSERLGGRDRAGANG
jgi:uncharacterized protein (TIGR00369 family)